MTQSPLSLKFIEPTPPLPGPIDEPWITGTVKTSAYDVPVAATELNFADSLGTWKARWGINRMRYTVEPRLYAVGNPNADSPVFASANYKLSFDALRSKLGEMDAWILVMDTKGINVWCAAGKGTFGTNEMLQRIKAARLDQIVTHRRIIVPQLGAPGISAHEVRKQSGFRVVYGPVRASDIKAFMETGMKATPEMRRVRFPLRDRVVLIPLEMIPGLKYTLPTALAFFILSGFYGPGIFSVSSMLSLGGVSVLLLLLGFFGGTALSPALLPWIPGRSFAFKGFTVGAGLFMLAFLMSLMKTPWQLGAWAFMIPTVSSFFAMNFTGSSTYTSLSGVMREMRIAVPAQIAAAVVGIGLWITGLVV